MPKDRIRDTAERLPDPLEAHEHSINDCAKALLDWVGSLDPQWQTRIEILQNERGFSSKEAAASLMAYPLDTAQHMSITTNPMIQNAMQGNTSGKMVCADCGIEFKPQYGGQRPLCSNRCANSFDAKGLALKMTA